jgi:hypothetical protein
MDIASPELESLDRYGAATDRLEYGVSMRVKTFPIASGKPPLVEHFFPTAHVGRF